MSNPIALIKNFLLSETPDSWAMEAKQRIPELLIDHANCELKAASSALSYIYKYPQHEELCQRMSRIAREELRHYEQVRTLMRKNGIKFKFINASRYASELRGNIRGHEPNKLLDSLIIGALIEARSCERFFYLAKFLPSDIKIFYEKLMKSEARHFLHYLNFAKQLNLKSSLDFTQRVKELKLIERDLINKPDKNFGFHSGPLVD